MISRLCAILLFEAAVSLQVPDIWSWSRSAAGLVHVLAIAITPEEGAARPMPIELNPLSIANILLLPSDSIRKSTSEEASLKTVNPPEASSLSISIEFAPAAFLVKKAISPSAVVLETRKELAGVSAETGVPTRTSVRAVFAARAVLLLTRAMS